MPPPLNINILLPLAGEGSRFKNAGYVQPKPMVDVNGKPMIRWVLDNVSLDAPGIGPDSKYIFILRTAHQLEETMRAQDPRVEVVFCDALTEGAACTTLLAADLIDNDTPLLIANSDQFMEWDWEAYVRKMQEEGERGIDGNILCFYLPMEKNDTKWSYAAVDEDGIVTDVQEKVVISPHATVGLYYWRRGKDYVAAARQMIAKNVRVNNEFYVAPVYNQSVLNGGRHTVYYCDRMWGLGVPNDVTYFLRNYLGVDRLSIDEATARYAHCFHTRDLAGCAALMAPQCVLTDSGRDTAIIPYVRGMFEEQGSELSFRAVNIFVDHAKRVSVIEFELVLKGGKELRGTDVISWSQDPLMTSLRAYLY